MRTIEPAVVDRLFELFAKGWTPRQAAKEMEIGKNTAERWREKLERWFGAFECPCGRSAKHRGWCSVRFGRSRLRQNVMRNVNYRRRLKVGDKLKVN